MSAVTHMRAETKIYFFKFGWKPSSCQQASSPKEMSFPLAIFDFPILEVVALRLAFSLLKKSHGHVKSLFSAAWKLWHHVVGPATALLRKDQDSDTIFLLLLYGVNQSSQELPILCTIPEICSTSDRDPEQVWKSSTSKFVTRTVKKIEQVKSDSNPTPNAVTVINSCFIFFVAWLWAHIITTLFPEMVASPKKDYPGKRPKKSVGGG